MYKSKNAQCAHLTIYRAEFTSMNDKVNAIHFNNVKVDMVIANLNYYQ